MSLELVGAASVQVIARFGESVLHVWTGRPDASLDVAALTNGASSSTSKPFFVEGDHLAVFGAPLALGDRAAHVVDGLRLEISYDAPVGAPPRGKVASRVVLGAIASLVAHAAFATSIATSDAPSDATRDGSNAADRAAALARLPSTPRPPVYRVRWASDLASPPPSADVPSAEDVDMDPAPSTDAPSKDGTLATNDRRASASTRPTPPARDPRAVHGRDPSWAHATTTPKRRRGNLDPLVVQRVVNGSRGRFQMCVATARQIDPGIAGRVAVSFAISAEGRVTGAVVTESPAPGLGACVRSTFESLSFPRPEGGEVRVVYPFAVSRDG